MLVVDLLARLGVDASGAAVENLPHNTATAGAWRVRGPGGLDAALKHVTAAPPSGLSEWQAHWFARSGDPHHWNYWCREALAFRDGLTTAYGLAGPACIAAVVDEGDAILLTEWIAGAAGPSWPLSVYGEAAFSLGRAQGAHAGAAEKWPWLSRHYLRDYSSEKPVDYGLLDSATVWDHPLARSCFPAELRDRASTIHANRERLYAINAALPRTLCHLDVWPMNLFRRPDGRFAIIDWAFAGDGAVGEDIGNIVPDSCFDFFVPADEFAALETVVFDGYLEGLRESGWDDDPRLVQLGMWSSAVKYDWLLPLLLNQLDSEVHKRYGGHGEVDAEYKFRQRGQTFLHLIGWAEQALEWADRLRL